MMGLLQKKKFRISALILLILLLAGTATYFIWSENAKKTTDDYLALCNEDSIGERVKENSNILLPENLETLEPIAQEVLELENGSRSVNCLFVMTYYYIAISDYAKAKDAYTALKQAKISGSVDVNDDLRVTELDLDQYMDFISEREKEQPWKIENKAPTIKVEQ